MFLRVGNDFAFRSILGGLSFSIEAASEYALQREVEATVVSKWIIMSSQLCCAR